MTLNIEQLNIASQIDDRMRELERVHSNDTTILAEMLDLMPGFKQLMDTTGQRGMDELCARFQGFYRYAKILENLAADIHSGKIKVPI